MANEKIISYIDILDAFGEEKVGERYDNLNEQLIGFIRRKGYENSVAVSASLLRQMVIDYFTDIYRLKEFHNIDLANYIKITAYTAYWLIQRKPLQIIKEDSQDMELAFCNENFVVSYILRFLQKDLKSSVNDPEGKYQEFVSNLSYALRYRVLTPQMLELMLEGFSGGRVFQQSL